MLPPEWWKASHHTLYHDRGLRVDVAAVRNIDPSPLPTVIVYARKSLKSQTRENGAKLDRTHLHTNYTYVVPIEFKFQPQFSR